MDKKTGVIIGAGPAGLTAAWELTKANVEVMVFEKYSRVGGIARTEEYKGYRFDIGGHRFFTMVPEVEELWHEWMQEEFVIRPRKSRILYRGKFFDYPLRMFNALRGLGILESVRIVISYVIAQFFPYKKEESFEHWVVNRFGKRLYEIFFKTYTEKVWGIKCTDIRAEWAAQRIKGLTLPAAIKNALFPPRGEVIKTLIKEFHYPVLGPGMMWEKVTDLVREAGGCVEMESEIVRIFRDEDRIDGVEVKNSDGLKYIEGTDFFSTMPLNELIRRIEPAPPEEVIVAADGLRYRDFLTVVLILDIVDVFDDNWVYIHSPNVKVGRIQNFKNWSADMVPDNSTTSLGLEYFCNEGDGLWKMSDTELLELGSIEIEQLGLAEKVNVLDGIVMRQQKAYPVYDAVYGPLLATVQDWVTGLSNFHTIGRNGLHKYNNQDHSMLTAIMAVNNVLTGQTNDVWSVNTDRSYHEEVRIPRGGDDPVDILEA
ncbi:MAG TPA: FAD-dependent oxidoreductase [Chloroflexi bacterium]|nr:FAD-dependent oxidoreductase [Chloroflexota bacterium]